MTSDIVLLLALLACSAFFSGSEAGLFGLDPIQTRKLQGSRGFSSRWARALLHRPGELLTTLLVGNTIVNVAFSVVGTTIFLRLLGDAGVEWSILVLSLLVLVFGEVTPKTLAVNFPLSAARLSSIPLRATAIVLRPVTAVFLWLSRLCLRLLGVRGELHPGRSFSAAREVQEVFREGDAEIEMSDHESRLARRILEFSGTTAEEVMTPRVDMVCAPADMDPEGLKELARSARHSRIPIYKRDVDHIVGFLHVKGFFLNPEQPLERLLRPVAIYPETTPINRIFYEIQRSRRGMVIVVNEFGETMGLITREDLIEEIVGDIYDEYEKAVPDIVPAGEGLYIVRGGTSLETLNSTLGLRLPVEASVTLNGFLCELAGHIPQEGSRITYDGVTFHVLEVLRHRVQKVRLELAREARSESSEGTGRS